MNSNTHISGTILATLLLWCGTASALADDYTYATNNGAITIARYTGPGGAVSIPDTIYGMPVTGIGSHAFDHSNSVTSVTIPGSVTNIGSFAFAYCTGMTNLTIGNSVKSIGDAALAGCSRLTCVVLPNGVTTIGIQAFHDCPSLTDVIIPNSVTSIGMGTFECCSSLTGVTIPNSVTDLGSSVFSGCGSLTGMTIPNSVTSIQTDAFGHCVGLTNIVIGNGVTNIGGWAFQYCSSLTSITLPNSVAGIGYSAFYNCTGLASVTISNSLASMGDYAFYGCASLPHITLPSKLPRIGDRTFYCCTSLTNIAIPDSVTTIGQGAFYGCSSLATVTIGSGVTSILGWVFYECPCLTEITVAPANPAYSSVGGVLFNKSLTALVMFPVGRTGSYTISNSVTAIEDGAFWGCSRLTSLTMPSGLTWIGDFTFAYSSNVALYFKGNAPAAGGHVFTNAVNVSVYYLPGSLYWGVTYPISPPGMPVAPTALWRPRLETSDDDFGVRTNRFGFEIAWASGRLIVVEACTNLSYHAWSSLQTNTLTEDWLYFSDPQWTNYARCFYRVRSP
jgi:hypothetical protein